MRDTNSEFVARIKACDAELDRFKAQAATILTVCMTFAITTSSALLLMLL